MCVLEIKFVLDRVFDVPTVYHLALSMEIKTKIKTSSLIFFSFHLFVELNIVYLSILVTFIYIGEGMERLLNLPKIVLRYKLLIPVAIL